MKLRTILAGLLAASAPAGAQVLLLGEYNNVNLAIPDGNPSGAFNTQTLSGANNTILNVRVTLTLESGEFGAWNGDYYAFLTHGSGTSILLNRIGRTSSNNLGSSTEGFASVTFSDSAPRGDIHNFALVDPSSPLTGPWAPDGRATLPNIALDSDPRTRTLSQLNGENSAGDWTLYLADMNSGGDAILRSWTLEVTVVPEPAEITAAIAAALSAFAAARRFKLRRKL